MSTLKIALTAVVTFVILEALIFRSGFYDRYLEPSSSTGLFESVLRDEENRKPFGPDEILVTGDSRMGEGFSARVANNTHAENGYYFASVAVPGSTPRCWYYFLRDLDPTRKRYKAIIFPVESYEDVDTFEDLNDRLLDLHYCIARLRYSDVFEFASSFRTARRRMEVFRGCLFKGIIYQPDLLAFFEHRRKRLIDTTLSRKYGWEWRDNYGGREEDLSGLRVDWRNKTIHFPERLSAADRGIIEEKLFGPIPKQDGTMAAYRRKWFGKILDLYRNSDTRMVFMALPRGPAPPPVPRVQPVSRSIRDFGGKPGVILLPENAFASLERGELYFDSLHFNAKGRVQFSTMLGHLMQCTLGPGHN